MATPEPAAAWACARCGAASSAHEVWTWDGKLRRRLALAQERAAHGEEGRRAAERELEAVLTAALERCHPNHAVVLEARLGLVA